MTLREQAEHLRLGLLLKMIDGPRVIDWADQIVLEGNAPIEIIDISLAVAAPLDELERLLRDVRGEANLTGVAHALLTQIADTLDTLSLGSAVSRLYFYGRHAVIPADEAHETQILCDLHDDLVGGYYGSNESVWRAIHSFVDKYSHPQPGCRL